jgi:hypothetical protein
VFLPSVKPSFSSSLKSPLARFDGAEDENLLGIFNEIANEHKGKEFALKGFKSLPFVDAKDVEVNPLFVIFNLKGILVGKEYFKINHLLPPPFNLA